MGSSARPVKPFGRGRLWLRRTRALWRVNFGSERFGGGQTLSWKGQPLTACSHQLHHIAVFAPFATLDANDHPLLVDVAELNRATSSWLRIAGRRWSLFG